jgi:hypothetical protein
MIKLIINSLENKVDMKILDAKEEIRAQGESKLGEIKAQLPSQEEIINTLKSEGLSRCNPTSQAQMERVYNKFARKLNRALKITERTNQKISNIQSKLDRIKDEVIPKIKRILEILSITIGIFKPLVKALPIVMGFLKGRFADEWKGKKLGDLIDVAKGKIEIFKNAITGFSSTLKKSMSKILKLLTTLAPIIVAIVALENLIKLLLTNVELLYLSSIQLCAGVSGDDTDGQGNMNEDLALYSLEDALAIGNEAFNQLLDELGLSGNEEVIEKLYNAEFQMIGYKRYKT